MSSRTGRTIENLNITGNLSTSIIAKGDILAANGTNFTNLNIGTNDQILVANSTESQGIEYTDPNTGQGQRFRVSFPVFSITNSAAGNPSGFNVFDNTGNYFLPGYVAPDGPTSQGFTVAFILPPSFDNTMDINLTICFYDITGSSNGDVQFDIEQTAFDAGDDINSNSLGSSSTSSTVNIPGSSDIGDTYFATATIRLKRTGGGSDAVIGDFNVIGVIRNNQSYNDDVRLTAILIDQ